MDISKYSAYFHDGDLIDFKHIGNRLEISMASAEILPEEMIENMPPLIEYRISGKLYLDGVKKITIDKELFVGILKIAFDAGEILDFDVLDDKIILFIEWTDYPPKTRKTDYSTIEIEAEKIDWENIPDISKKKVRIDKYLDAKGNPVPAGHRDSRLYSC